ncbi:MAG TPA: DUF58 domain-containing protein [Planctomycetota bacterium]|nr:DUF58 domain-containing protein [Planctomycetota bacterium]
MSSLRRPTPRASFRINGRGWIYLALAASVAFAAALKGNNLLFAIFCLLIAQFIVTAVLTVVVARGIDLSRILPPTAVASEVFPLGIRLRNLKRFWPAFCLRIEDRMDSAGRPASLPPTPVWIPMAGARKRVRTTSYATAGDRGWARLGPFTVVSEFPPGFFTYRRVVPVVNRLLVLPRVGILSRRLLEAMLAPVDYSELASNDFQAGREEFAGLRDYRDGDSPRDIHWKMSSRLPGRLLVREHEDPRVRDAVILLESHVPKTAEGRRRGRLERAIRFAATLADVLLADQYRVRFRAFAPDPLAVDLDPRGRELETLLQELAILRPTRTRPLSELLAEAEIGRDDAVFILRIGEDPLSRPEDLRNATILTPVQMKGLLEDSDLGEKEPE